MQASRTGAASVCKLCRLFLRCENRFHGAVMASALVCGMAGHGWGSKKQRTALHTRCKQFNPYSRTGSRPCRVMQRLKD